jgi:hypothetical protein
LQWVDQKSLIYNVIHEGYVRAKKTCITNGSSEIFPIPISILNGVDGFASIDYFAMTEGSEYGYPGIKCESFNSRVQYYRFSDQTITTFFDWRELSPKLLIAGATKEHINHILFAPNGKYFVYIHRFWVNKRRFDSLIGFDIDKKTLEPIITNQTVSHYCWKDDSTLFAWLIINGNPGYYYIDILTKEYTLVYAEDDGHPNWLFGDVYITDRYVGSRFGGNLLQAEIVNLSTKKNFPLVKLSHPAILDYSHRCDMHISISNNKSRFQLDSRHLHNKRTVIVGCLPDLCRNTSLYHL